ncbi:hypothetical protein [Vibrio tubiashii]|uniref:hypothetical protein n=1 Tax=Vibrio tubiashii TaxID=29498 RepID=UPI00349E5D1E
MQDQTIDIECIVVATKRAMLACQNAPLGLKMEECHEQKVKLLYNGILPKEVVESIYLYALIPSIKTGKTQHKNLVHLFTYGDAVKKILEDELNMFCIQHGARLYSPNEHTLEQASLMYQEKSSYSLITYFLTLEKVVK